MKELVVDATSENGESIKLVLKSPTAEQLKNAKLVSARAFKEGLSNKMLLRATITDCLREQGVWNDQKEEELKNITFKLSESERRLAMGAANGFTKKDAKNLAIEMRKLRVKQAELLTKTRDLDEHTVEAYAENSHFDYLVSVCSFLDDGRELFKDVNDYKEKSGLPYAIIAATNFAKLYHNFNEDWEKDLPENKFLLKYGFVNEKLMFVNKEKQLVDEDGRLVNADGRYINVEGEYVDRDGNRVDEAGKPLEVFVEFPEDEE